MEKFIFNDMLPEYQQTTRRNIKKLKRALNTGDMVNIKRTMRSVYGHQCVNFLLTYECNCRDTLCRDCREQFIKDISEQVNHKSNLYIWD